MFFRKKTRDEVIKLEDLFKEARNRVKKESEGKDQRIREIEEEVFHLITMGEPALFSELVNMGLGGSQYKPRYPIIGELSTALDNLSKRGKISIKFLSEDMEYSRVKIDEENSC